MKIALLGTASAVCSADRDNTTLVVETNEALIPIDCSGSTAKKLLQLGFDFTKIDHVLITHWHPDHVYGLPGLLHEMQLLGRRRKLTLYLPRSSQRIIEPFVRALFVDIPDLFPIEYHPIDMVENVLLVGGDTRARSSDVEPRVWSRAGEYEVYSTPVQHSHDTLAYKIVENGGETSFVYSSDTQPSESLIRFAGDADLLIHECTYLDGEPAAVNTTHSNARQVGQVAARAGVKQLGLVHLGIEAMKHPEIALRQAQENFAGPVVVGQDMMVFQI